MRRMVATVLPERPLGSPFYDEPGYGISKDPVYGDGYAFRGNVLWHRAKTCIAVGLGPQLDELEENKQAALQAKADVGKLISDFALPMRLFMRYGQFRNAIKSDAQKQKMKKDMHTIMYANVADGALHMLVDTIRTEAYASEAGSVSLYPEEWVTKTMERADTQEYNHMTGDKPENLPLVIGQSALLLVQMPLFHDPQPLISNSYQITLQSQAA